MASEAGVIDIPAQDIAVSGRLEPGRIFFINTDDNRIIHDDELKSIMARKQPYGQWLRENLVELDNIPARKVKKHREDDTMTLLKAFGYTRDDMKYILKPMAADGKEP